MDVTHVLNAFDGPIFSLLFLSLDENTDLNAMYCTNSPLPSPFFFFFNYFVSPTFHPSCLLLLFIFCAVVVDTYIFILEM